VALVPIGVFVPKALIPDRDLALMDLALMDLALMDLALAIASAVRAVVANVAVVPLGGALEGRAVVASVAVVPLRIVPPPAVPHRTAVAWTVTGLPVSNG